jgi:hypothetical protein
MSFETAAQEIIYATLNGAISCDVYDDVPFLPEGAPDDAFPYVVIGDDTHTSWDNDDIVGTSATITLHFWSRYQGRKEVKSLMGEARGLLNRASLSKAGYKIVDCLFEFSESFTDPDGRTRHGVQRYRLTLQEI